MKKERLRMAEFPQDVIDAICDYMNNDPMESSLTIVQGLKGDRSVTKVTMKTFDGNGCVFEAQSPSGSREIRIPWLREISERPEVREQLFALLDRASDAFGS